MCSFPVFDWYPNNTYGRDNGQFPGSMPLADRALHIIEDKFTIRPGLLSWQEILISMKFGMIGISVGKVLSSELR